MLGWILFTLVWTLVVFLVSFLIGIASLMSYILEHDEKLYKQIEKLIKAETKEI